MDEEEYISRIDAVLRKFGGSYDRPSGWQNAEGAMSFSCAPAVIIVPLPQNISVQGRVEIVRRIEARFKDF